VAHRALALVGLGWRYLVSAPNSLVPLEPYGLPPAARTPWPRACAWPSGSSVSRCDFAMDRSSTGCDVIGRNCPRRPRLRARVSSTWRLPDALALARAAAALDRAPPRGGALRCGAGYARARWLESLSTLSLSWSARSMAAANWRRPTGCNARARPAQHAPVPVLVSPDLELCDQHPGAGVDGCERARALVGVRPDHDHRPRPFIDQLKRPSADTAQSGRCHAPIRSRRRSWTAAGDRTETGQS
jgi:hypothetical protein